MDLYDLGCSLLGHEIRTQNSHGVAVGVELDPVLLGEALQVGWHGTTRLEVDLRTIKSFNGKARIRINA